MRGDAAGSCEEVPAVVSGLPRQEGVRGDAGSHEGVSVAVSGVLKEE